MSRPYRGHLAEARAAQRRERLVQAGIELVGTGGVSAMTMRAVCRQAGLSQKFFYESFTDGDQLLHAVYRTTLERALAAIDDTAGDPAETLHAQTRRRVDAAALLVRDDPRICRILLIEPVADLRLRRYVRRLATAAFGDYTDPTAETPRVKMHYATVFGAVISLFIEWTEGNLGEDRTVFVDHVTDMLMASPLVRTR